MRQPREVARAKSTAARSSLALLAALLVAGAAILAAWLARDRGAPGETAGAGPDLPRRPTSMSAASPRETELDGGAGVPARASEAAPAASAPPDRRFEGRGTIRGQVVTQAGVPFPERWTLLLEPHPWLEGRDRAASRRIDFEHGEREFRVEDLPLAGYLVRVRSGGLNNLPCSVLLVRGSEDQHVTTALLPTGFVDGSALDHLGRPAEGLDVTLESLATRERRTQATDAAGSFLFRDVVDGEYRLTLGRPDSPLLPAESLAFRAPSMRIPTRSLPPTGRLRILALDPQSRPQPRTAITGFASPGGAIDAATNERGVADVRYLPPGRYRIDARTEDGRTGNVTVEVAAGSDADVAVVVSR